MKNLSFEGKLVVVTGASGDIGSCIAKRFLEYGAVVIGQGNKNRVKLDSLSKEFPTKLYIWQVDGTNEKNLEKMVRNSSTIFSSYGGVAVLVNCAGDLLERRSVSELTWKFISEIFNINVKIPFLFTTKLLPYMTSNANIIFISSSTGKYGKGDRSSAYGMAKAAMDGWMRCLANELGPKGIRVNSVAPGYIEGSFHNRFTKPEIEAQHRERNPLRRNGTGDDVADSVILLAGSNYINGVNLDVNGAEYMS